MTKKIIHTFLSLAAALLCLCSCVKEDFAPQGGTTFGEGLLQLNFGPQDNVCVQTRATLDTKSESRIFNLYVFVFDAAGNKVSGEYFDTRNLKTQEFVSTATENCWWVSNATTNDGKTTGGLVVKTAAGEGLTVYVLTNLDSDMVKVSSNLLSATIHNENDLRKFNAYLNQRITSRNGYFPMTGKLSSVKVINNEGSNTVHTVIKETMLLKRIDAKVRFIFKQGSRPDENGQVIKKFEARQWKVVNVPRTSYMLSYDQRGTGALRGQDFVNVNPDTPEGEYSKYAKDYFETDFVNFEDFPQTGQSEFSFYMLENCQVPKKTPLKYQDRSRDLKENDGKNRKCEVSYSLDGVEYTRTMREFEYANDFSTYVVVTGYVEMALKNDEAGNVLGGDVQYIIHLGDWNAIINNDTGNQGDGKDSYSAFDNFNTERNTSYTYTVTVNGVNSIRVEVETSKGAVSDVIENQPGASGQISIAKEEIAICDCHYVSKTISFHLNNFFKHGNITKENCIVDELTWAVKTPFGEGEPSYEGVHEITTGLDYQWVHFRLNKQDGDGNYFKDKRRKYTPREFESSNTFRTAEQNKEDDGTAGLAGYHNDGIMDVRELCKFIKDEVNKYLVNPATSAFDHKDATDLSLPNICLTVFVDEYYYNLNPVNGQRSSDLWKSFVNKDDRKLHILCNSEKSKDGESSSTGSVVTIQQRSIQCIYNTDLSYTALQTAWGVENTDEYDGRWDKYWSVTSATDEKRGNNKAFNGLFNSCKEWDLSPKGVGNNSFSGGNWSKYMNYEVPNDTPQLLDEYAYMRYSCLTRNRDNNGDGKIDRSEVRWYLASINQLLGLYVGDGLLNTNTKLYNKSPEDRKSSDSKKWQQHIVSSTCFAADDPRESGPYANSGQEIKNSNNPTMLWAEEGTSTGHFYHNYSGDIQGSAIRCVRNLGYIDGNEDETYAIDKEPDDYIKVEKRSDGSYVFTCTHLNEQALRYYTSKELIFADETSQENRLYKKFESYPTQSTRSENPLFKDYNAAVDKSVAEGNGNPYCPEGYRTPNQTEAAIMRYYMDSGENCQTMTRTYWSFGPFGNNVKNQTKYGFVVSSVVTVNNEQALKVRCVRDLRVN